MTTCLILRGVPGSGKSTIAEKTGYEIISRDDIRLRMLGGEEVFSDEGLVTAVQDALISYHLKAGTDVVIDNTNVEWKYVRGIAALAFAAGADVKIQVLDIDLDEALRRNAERGRLGGREVPYSTISNYHKRLQISKDWTL